MWFYVIISILLIGNANAATLTVNNVPKVNTGGSTPKLEDSSISEVGGNVGIGSTIPVAKLEVAGNATVQGVQLKGFTTTVPAIYPLTDSNTGFSFSGPDIISIDTGGLPGVVVTSAQNVGIATSVVTSKLYVYNAISGNSLRVDDEATDTTPFVIDSTGNTGIGSATPGQKLDVNGTVRASAFVSNAVTAGLVQLYEASANGSNYINWTSPSSLSTDVEYTLPSTLGTVGQIFTLANSSGGINWSSVPTGSGVSGITTNYIPKAASSTSLNDSNIIQEGATNVGISTTGPQSLFAVGSTSQFQVNSSGAIAASTGITTSGGYTQSGTTANTFTGTPTFSNATYSGLFTGGNVGIGSATPGQKLDVVGTLRVIGTGNVGINSSNPGQQLDVVGTIRASVGFNSVGIGTTVPQQLCRKANGDFGYFNGAWSSTCN